MEPLEQYGREGMAREKIEKITKPSSSWNSCWIWVTSTNRRSLSIHGRARLDSNGKVKLDSTLHCFPPQPPNLSYLFHIKIMNMHWSFIMRKQNILAFAFSGGTYFAIEFLLFAVLGIFANTTSINLASSVGGRAPSSGGISVIISATCSSVKWIHCYQERPLSYEP